MKIALTSPTNWPHVRRGAERFLNELASYCAAQGHDVTVISAGPAPTAVTDEGGFRTVAYRRLWHPVLARVGLLEFHAFFLRLLPHLCWNRYDLVIGVTFLDTYAAALARRVTGTPCVYWVNSLPPRIRYFRSLTLGGAVYRHGMRHADEVVALSRYMQDALAARFGRGGICIPVPVDTARFPLAPAERDLARPTVLCASALDDRRKGGRLLMRAFNAVKRARPEVALHVSAAVSDAAQAELLNLVDDRWRADVTFLGAGSVADLPSVMGRAAVLVLPSLWEAFGMVIVEAMACGTPVVGTRDGAIPELITPDVGRLFDPGDDAAVEPTNVDGLAAAILECLALSARPETRHRCRAHAEQYSWARVGPRFEEMFSRVTAARMAAALQSRSA